MKKIAVFIILNLSNAIFSQKMIMGQIKYCSISFFFLLTPILWAQNKQITPDGLYILESKTILKDGETFGNSGELKVVTLDSEHLLVSLEVSIGAPSYNSGIMVDTLYYKNNIAIYKNQCESDASCVITLQFSKSGVTVTQEQNDLNFGCGFGHAVFADGFYKRRKNSKPTQKEILETENR